MYKVAALLRNTMAQEGQTAVVPKGALVRRSSHKETGIYEKAKRNETNCVVVRCLREEWRLYQDVGWQ